MVLQTQISSTYIEAGCDEAGRGPLAGPVVAATVILPKKFHLPLLNDSKKLTAKQREKLVPLIKAEALVWAIGQASVQEIDQHNILQASFIAMHRAIDQLIAQLRPTLLLIDGNRFIPYIGIPHKCIVKGDAKFASIAAASILAKTHRDSIMHALAIEYPVYGWHTNMGYPTYTHRKAIHTMGFTAHHRRSFRVRKGDAEV